MGTEDRLRQAMRRWADSIEPSKGDSLQETDDLARRATRREVRRKSKVVFLVAIVGIGAAFILRDLSPLGVTNSAERSPILAHPTASFTPRFQRPSPGHPVPAAELDPHISQVVPVQQGLQTIAAGNGSVWVSTPSQQAGQPDTLQIVEEGTGRVIGSIQVQYPPTDLGLTAAGLWVSLCPDAGCRIELLDPFSGKMLMRADGVGPYFAADSSGVWAQGTSGRLEHLDPSGSIAGSVDLGLPTGYSLASDVVLFNGGAWVLAASQTDGAPTLLCGVTESSGQTVTMPTAADPKILVAGDTALWLSSGYTAIKMQPGYGDSVTYDIPEGFNPFGNLAGRIWFVGSGETKGYPVYALDEASGRVIEGPVWLPASPALRFPLSVATDEGSATFIAALASGDVAVMPTR
jgi:hypothetical protein